MGIKSFFGSIFKRTRYIFPSENSQLQYRSSADRLIDANTTAFSAVNRISATIAGLSFGVYDHDTRQKVQFSDVYQVLKKPNIDETHYTFMFNSIKDYFSGNIYWYQVRNDSGRLVALYRLDNNRVTVHRDPVTHIKRYLYMGVDYGSETILHIPSIYGYDGLIGHSIFSEQKKVFNDAANLDEYTDYSFGHSWGKKVIIDVTNAFKDLTPKQKDQLRDKYEAENSGINIGRPIVNTGGIEFKTIETGTSDNRSQQLIENRQFSEHEVSKIFSAPLPILSPSEKVDNIESLYMLYLDGSIEPICRQIEEAINTIFPVYEDYYFEFNYNSVLRTSLTAKTDNYIKSLQNGLNSINEIRAKENESPTECGDVHFIAANLMPLRQDIIDAYMAGAKLKQLQIDGNTQGTNEAPGVGDDKQ